MDFHQLQFFSKIINIEHIRFMKITDLKIGNQLKLGFGIIVLFILILSYIAWEQTVKMANETTLIYNNPLQVRRALGELKTDILLIHRGMKDLGFSQNEKELSSIIQEIEIYKTDANKQFDILYDRYLGPKNDIDSTFNNFVKWNTIREETMRLFKNGKVEEAISRTKRSGEGGKL